MWFNPYAAVQIQEERIKDALRKAEQARLIRQAEGTRTSRRRQWSVTLTFQNLLSIFSNRSVDEPCRQSSSTVPGPTSECCADAQIVGLRN
jgi:hypothetical protein